MAKSINSKPNLKKTFAEQQRLDDAMKAKTALLSDEAKAHINEVSGQNKANEVPLGKQEGTVDKLGRVRPTGGSHVKSVEG